jgi:hypothetical protein
MGHSVEATIGDKIRLLGYDLERQRDEMVLTLHWQAMMPMEKDYKVFVHLFDPCTEGILAQQDVLAGSMAAPTSTWVTRQVVSDSIELDIGAVLAGHYSLAIGLYHGDQRLEISVPDGFVTDSRRLILESFHIP